MTETDVFPRPYTALPPQSSPLSSQFDSRDGYEERQLQHPMPGYRQSNAVT